MNELSEEEIKVLKEVAKREVAVGLVWSWIRNFLYVAVPITTLYTFFEYLRGR
jgi:protein-S-isoprenylcysteine O-methyltransferase Ste14